MELGMSGAGGGMFSQLFEAGLSIGGQYANKALGINAPVTQADRLNLPGTSGNPAEPEGGGFWDSSTAVYVGVAVMVVFVAITWKN